MKCVIAFILLYLSEFVALTFIPPNTLILIAIVGNVFIINFFLLPVLEYENSP